jgi:hypothetical protein
VHEPLAVQVGQGRAEAANQREQLDERAAAGLGQLVRDRPGRRLGPRGCQRLEPARLRRCRQVAAVARAGGQRFLLAKRRALQRGCPPGILGLPGPVLSCLTGNRLAAQSAGEIVQRRAVVQLHGIPREAVRDALVEDADDAGVAQAGQGVDLAADSREQALVRDAHGLERGGQGSVAVLCPVDDTHGALAERLEDAPRADVLRELCHSRDSALSGYQPLLVEVNLAGIEICP